MRFIIGLFLFGVLFSCGQDNHEEKKSSYKLKDVKPLFKNEGAFENEIKNIESDKNLIEVTSLEYLSNEGESFVVKGLVETKKEDQGMTIKKLQLKQISAKGIETTYSYYYIGIRKFASYCEQFILNGNSLDKTLTKSYYDDSSEVIFSKRTSVSSEKRNENNYSKCEPINHDDQLVLKIINQEDEFETKFQGFTENMGKIYLILGTDHFTSAIAFTEFNPTLKILKNNEKKYLGNKLIVDFSVVEEANGFTFQALKDIRFAQ